MDHVEALIWGLALILAGIGCIVYFVKVFYKYNLIKNIPRSKIRSAAIGLVELQGNAEADSVLTTPFSQTPCLYYEYQLWEYKVTRHYSSRGKGSSSGRWTLIDSKKQGVPFFLKDETGVVFIDMQNADTKLPVKRLFANHTMLSAFSTIKNAVSGNFLDPAQRSPTQGYTELDPAAENLETSFWKKMWLNSKNNFIRGIDSAGDRKIYERYIEPHENLYVIGTLDQYPNDPQHLLMHKGSNEPTYIVSTRSEEVLLKALKAPLFKVFICSCLCFIIGTLLLLSV